MRDKECDLKYCNECYYMNGYDRSHGLYNLPVLSDPDKEYAFCIQRKLAGNSHKEDVIGVFKQTDLIPVPVIKNEFGFICPIVK